MKDDLWDCDDIEWETIHTPRNSKGCYDVAIAALREKWLAENRETANDHENHTRPCSPAADPERGAR